MIKPLNDLLEDVRNIIEDATTDAAIALLEDISDTISDAEQRASDTTNWEERYQQLDSDWRERYSARFFNGEVDDPEPEPEPEETVIKSYEELFEEKEG